MSSFLDKSGLERYHNGIKAKLATKSDNTHTHDDRYYTETEVDNKLATKSDTSHNHSGVYSPVGHTHDYAPSSHTHDDRYYTESEINTKLAGKVSKRENGNYYNSVGSFYTGSTNPTYYRITLSDNALSIWNMQFIEISMRQQYGAGKSGKILINCHNDASNKWLQFNASVFGNLTNDIKVYGYGGKYIYIAGGSSWGGISIDTVLVGDGATNQDITYSIDVVTSLPSGYVSATMLYYNVLSSHTHDDRYYTESEIDTKLSGKSDTSHNHSGVYSPVGHTHSDYVTSQYLGQNYYSKTEVDDGFATASHNHDSKYAAISHNHDDRYYTETEVDNKLAGKSDTSHTHNYAPSSHTHDDRYYTETEINNKLAGKSDTSHNHSGVYSPVGHTHSDYVTSAYLGQNYYSKTQVDDGFATVGHTHNYAPASHTHDDRYYTETEINNKLAGKSDTSHNHSGVYAPASHSHSPSEISGYVGSSAEGTPFVLGSEGAGASGQWIDLNAYYSLKTHTHTSAPALDIRTTAPTSNNTTGKLKVAVLSSEPSRKYNGWLYIITG